ncbi:MMPL family transporter [Jatrophihabitans cynanchi]|uniref:MMPL family transporter n=1 Tax=Jatrophihabitans cynanchi TaxID=2944128 RepID=A0ABY7JUQ0_9ACTN|nr:MMPL family transporter [Jatrophihabitans sp. SB3-54]WAX56058.1 MMPL family transporter [Jatrophihabitans sp. SB3-54]
MTTIASRRNPPPAPEQHAPGWLARLGAWSGTHLRVVLIGWLLVLVAFGAFAPQVESALSGAGWQDSGSQSVKARELIANQFSGLNSTALQVVVHDSAGAIASDPVARQAVDRASALLQADPRVSTVLPPQPGVSISQDGRTAIIQGGAKADPNEMVRAADELSKPITALSRKNVSVNLTGSSALWANFNQVNHSAMIKSEVLSWPVTMLVLVLAFGSLVAAGLPLMLTLVGLLTAAGALVLSTHIAPVSIWAMNFAMMFALALGIDYALFIVVRFRAALKRRADQTDRRQAAIEAVAETMGTAGKAVAFSGLTVLVSLSTVLLVPSPAFRSMALGIMLSVVAVLAATLTLLPAVLGRLGRRVDSGRIRLPGALDRAERRAERRAAAAAASATGAGVEGAGHAAHPHHTVVGLERLLHHWGALLHRRPWIAGGLVLVVIGILAWPVLSLRTGMPSIAIIPQSQTARAGYNQVVDAFGPGAPGTLSVVTPATEQTAALQLLRSDRGIAAAVPAGSSNGWTMTLAIPTTDASAPATGSTIDRLRSQLPSGTLVGGAAAENHDLEQVLSSRTPLVFGLLIGLGFLLLLVALGSPLIAFVGVVTNLASIAGAFGVAKLVFQDGHLSGLLGFEPQGFVDAWAPLFFGAMLSGVAMDYTLFLLSAAREHYDLTGDPQHAMRMALRTSGRVVVAAAGVMVAVFMTFALSGPLAPKEMGIILAVAVFLDALLIRMILLPVVLRLTGHGAWHQPKWLGRILPRVRFSH